MSTSNPQNTLQEYAKSTLGRPEDTYFYQLIPSGKTDKEAVFAVISSDDKIVQATLTDDSVTVRSTSSTAHRNVTRIASLRDFLITGGDDGNLRVVGNDGYVVACSQSGKAKSISAIACHPSLGLVAAGTASDKEGAGDVEIYIWQLLDAASGRLLAKAKLVQKYTESHMDTITELAFMQLPSGELRLVSTSTDGLVNVFNPSIEDEDEAVEETINNKSPVHFMTLAPPTGPGSLHSVFVISGEENMMMYQIGEGCSAISQEVDIRKTFGCDYTIKIATTAQGQVYLVTGAYKPETTSSPRIQIWNVSQDSSSQAVSLLASLEGAHGEEVVRDVWWDDNFSFALSCGEDGHVRAWKKNPGSGDKPETPRSKKHESGSRKDARFRPY